MLLGLLVFAAIVGAVFVLTATYNNLSAAAARATRVWNDLDALLRQRHDEIPRLLELCEAHLPRERAMFERVLETRATMLGARQTRATAALGKAESSLRAELAALIAVAEREPALVNNQTFNMLRQRSATLDAEIAAQRTRYDEGVTRYNLAIRRLPGNIVALLGGFRPLPWLDAGAS
jgi:LemA protein